PPAISRLSLHDALPIYRGPLTAPRRGVGGRRGRARRRPRDLRGGPLMAAPFIASEVAQGLRRNLSMTLAMIITTAVALGMLGAGDRKSTRLDSSHVSIS